MVLMQGHLEYGRNLLLFSEIIYYYLGVVMMIQNHVYFNENIEGEGVLVVVEDGAIVNFLWLRWLQ